MILPFAILCVVVGSINLMIMSSYHRDVILFYQPCTSSFTRIWLVSSDKLVSINKILLFGDLEKKGIVLKGLKNHSRATILVYFDTFVEN